MLIVTNTTTTTIATTPDKMKHPSKRTREKTQSTLNIKRKLDFRKGSTKKPIEKSVECFGGDPRHKQVFFDQHCQFDNDKFVCPTCDQHLSIKQIDDAMNNNKKNFMRYRIICYHCGDYIIPDLYIGVMNEKLVPFSNTKLLMIPIPELQWYICGILYNLDDFKIEIKNYISGYNGNLYKMNYVINALDGTDLHRQRPDLYYNLFRYYNLWKQTTLSVSKWIHDYLCEDGIVVECSNFTQEKKEEE